MSGASAVPPWRAVRPHLAVAIAYRAIQNGFEARFTTATALIDELATATRKGRLHHLLATYTHPHVFVISAPTTTRMSGTRKGQNAAAGH